MRSPNGVISRDRVSERVSRMRALREGPEEHPYSLEYLRYLVKAYSRYLFYAIK